MGGTHLKLPVDFGAIAIEHRQVQRPEIGVEILVHERFVDGKVVGVRGRLWLPIRAQSYKIKPI